MYLVACHAANGRVERVYVRATSEQSACRIAVARCIAEYGDLGWIPGSVL